MDNNGAVPDALPAPDPVTADLMAFLAKTPSPYHAAANAATIVRDAGFVEVLEADSWTAMAEGAWFVVRGGALVAWISPDGLGPTAPLRIIGAHTDSPNLRIKPRPDAGSAGWRQLAIEVYGGILNNSWLDRDLGLSGRVVLNDGSVRLVFVDRPLLRVSQLAVHLDREVNERGLILDRQSQLTPIWGLGDPESGEFQEWLAAHIDTVPQSVASWDLMVHDVSPPALLGRDAEFLAAGRLDNLSSCHAALRAIVDTKMAADAGTPLPNAAIVALFDHEEVGSGSTTGASGPLLETVLRRRSMALGGGEDELARSFSASVCVSADMAHSVHPNYVDRHEPAHRPIPNAGPVIKVNVSQRYASDAVTQAMFRGACVAADVPFQVFVSRNNQPCGSTIGPLTATRLGIATVDVGSAMLSMHSARELMGAHDQDLMVRAQVAFFTQA